ncbi:MAG: MerR family transcriptional regulator [Gammaproteobacteria bacterium]|nr:MerR family transcriptional regulator [Gammaproteobacteria bacterium]
MQGKKIKERPLSKVKRKKNCDQDLPAIPDKRYFTISEVGQLCAVKTYVLRYWEQEFTQLRPVKRRGNRRYYQAQDILLVRQIKKLLYEDGFTIEGARAQLSNTSDPASQSVKLDAMVKKIISELETVLDNLEIKTSFS